MILPAWDNRGVLPPVHPGAAGHSRNRSPYKCTLQELVNRFGITSDRLDLLGKLLEFRQELHRLGLTRGFQWIDGSFVQDIERLEGRAPRDIDIVTHYYLPRGYTDEDALLAAHPEAVKVFNPMQAKAAFKMDAYAVCLGGEADGFFTKEITYWYSMWSHRREDNAWKGFVEIDLSPQRESEGIDILLGSGQKPEGGEDEQ